MLNTEKLLLLLLTKLSSCLSAGDVVSGLNLGDFNVLGNVSLDKDCAASIGRNADRSILGMR